MMICDKDFDRKLFVKYFLSYILMMIVIFIGGRADFEFNIKNTEAYIEQIKRCGNKNIECLYDVEFKKG